MCFSATYSALALLLGVAGQVVLYSRNVPLSRALAVGLSALTAMQLFELVMWLHPCSGDHANIVNQVVSRIAMITNISQPLSIAISLLWAQRSHRLEMPWKLTMAAAAAYIPVTTWAIFTQWSRVTCSAPNGIDITGEICTETSCGLAWEWVDNTTNALWGPYHLLLHMAFISLCKPLKPTALLIMLYIVVSFYLSNAMHAAQRSVGSHWCFSAIVLPWLIAVLPLQKRSLRL